MNHVENYWAVSLRRVDIFFTEGYFLWHISVALALEIQLGKLLQLRRIAPPAVGNSAVWSYWMPLDCLIASGCGRITHPWRGPQMIPAWLVLWAYLNSSTPGQTALALPLNFLILQNIRVKNVPYFIWWLGAGLVLQVSVIWEALSYNSTRSSSMLWEIGGQAAPEIMYITFLWLLPLIEWFFLWLSNFSAPPPQSPWGPFHTPTQGSLK